VLDPQATQAKGEGPQRPAPVLPLPITQVVPGLVVAGPVPGLAEQVRDLHRRFRSA